MRIFTAIDFTPEIKDNLIGIIEQIKDQVGRANYTKRDNLHLTLVFIGEKNPAECDKIISHLSDIEFEPFNIEFTKNGRFGNLHWIGIKQNKMLSELQKRIADKLNIKPENNYQPHVTLAREVKFNGDLSIDITTMPMTMTVDWFHLMKSERINGVLRYTKITSHRASIQTQGGNLR